VASLLQEPKEECLFELEIDQGDLDGKSLFSAISTPIALQKDALGFQNERLKLSTLGIYGRDAEKATVLKAFEDLGTSSQTSSECPSQAMQRQMVLISGTSGTGKTKLAEILKEPVAQQNGLFVRGKFALNMIQQPYSGIADACAEICGTILDLRIHDPEKYKRVGEEIMTALDAELGLLLQVIPVLEEIVDVPVQYSMAASSSDPSSLNDSKSRIAFAFRRFIRVIAKVFSPLVMTLDDFQWADTSSFDLLEAMMTDREISGTLVIGIYRSNEVSTNPRLTEYLRSLAEEEVAIDFSTTWIEIKNLDVDAVHGIIQDVLACTDEAKSFQLAEICYTKTLGNPFFLLQFLSMLCQKKLLKMTPLTSSWTWNLDEIERNTYASDNVVDLLKARMRELPSDLSNILQVAACLGSTFDQSTLLAGISSHIDDEVQLRAAVSDLQNEGLLVKVSSVPPRFSFVHDKIHEAAVDLVPLVSRSKYRRDVGELLFQNIRADRLATEIFVVVNLLNEVEPKMLGRDSRLQMARLNHQASVRAVMVSAFDAAARYAERGIAFLDDDALVDDTYDVSLGLFTIGAKSEGALGNVETLERYCMAVLQCDDISLDDKFGVYNTWVDHLSNRNIKEAVALCIDILGRLNCHIPKAGASVGVELAWHLLRIKRRGRKLRLFGLKTMTDKTKLQVMHWLDRLFSCCYTSGDERLTVAVFRSLHLTLEHGISVYSSVAFVQSGLLLIGLKDDLQTANFYGDLGLELIEKGDTKALAARTLFVGRSFVSAWMTPLKDSFEPLTKAYNIGLTTGDTENMSWAAVNWLQLQLYAGANLDTLQVDFEELLSQMKAMKMHLAYTFMQPVYQAVLNLLGADNLDDPTNLVGKALSQDEFNTCLSDPFFKPSLCIHKCLVLTYFGKHRHHAELFAGMGPDYVAQALMAAPENMINTFVNGLSCFAAAHEAGEKRYATLGKVCRDRIKKWTKQGNPNVRHYDVFLDAEYYALKKKKGVDVVETYKRAISASLDGDFIQDAALACERLGEFHLTESPGNLDEGYRQIRQASEYWMAWGAAGKVRDLEGKYPFAFDAF